MTQVNRYLENKAMDRIDHALGRPVDPMAETYRTHFAASVGTDEAIEMAASGHWRDLGAAGDIHMFSVAPAGRAALSRHLDEIRDPHRLFVIQFDGHESSIVGTTPGNAKYRYWLELDGHLSFPDFCRRCNVRLADKKPPSHQHPERSSE